MKLRQLLEYGSANPFVAVVSALQLRLKEVDAAIEANSSSIFKCSLEQQLTNLKRYLESARNWIIPEPKLRASFHAALPKLLKYIGSTLSSLDDFTKIKNTLTTALHFTIERSHLRFGDFE